MDLFWNLSTGQIMTGAQSQVALQSLTFKRRDGAEIRLGFVRAGSSELVEIPSTSEIRFALKEPNEWDSDPAVFTAAFAVDGDGFWVGNPSLNTTELDALFGSDPEAASLTLMGEFTRRDDVGEPWNSTQTFSVTVNNDVIRGDEGTPTNADDPTDYLTAVQSEARYVRYDTAQSLSSGDQQQARENIGAMAPPVQSVLTDGASVNISGTTIVDVGTLAATIAAGQTYRVKIHGIVANVTGVAQTIHAGMEIDGLSLVLSGSATVAHLAFTAVQFEGYVTFTASNTRFTGFAILEPSSGVGDSVTAVVRNGYNSSSTAKSGALTLRAVMRGSTSDTTLTFIRQFVSIERM